MLLEHMMSEQMSNSSEGFFAEMRGCAKCILPETFLGIRFDEKGVCNYCLSYEPVKVHGEAELVKVLDKRVR